MLRETTPCPHTTKRIRQYLVSAYNACKDNSPEYNLPICWWVGTMTVLSNKNKLLQLIASSRTTDLLPNPKNLAFPVHIQLGNAPNITINLSLKQQHDAIEYLHSPFGAQLETSGPICPTLPAVVRQIHKRLFEAAKFSGWYDPEFLHKPSSYENFIFFPVAVLLACGIKVGILFLGTNEFPSLLNAAPEKLDELADKLALREEDKYEWLAALSREPHGCCSMSKLLKFQIYNKNHAKLWMGKGSQRPGYAADEDTTVTYARKETDSTLSRAQLLPDGCAVLAPVHIGLYAIDILRTRFQVPESELQKNVLRTSFLVEEAVHHYTTIMTTSGSNNNVIQLLDIRSDPPRETLTLEGHESNVTVAEFSRSGLYLASASADSVRVWDLATGVSIPVPHSPTHSLVQLRLYEVMKDDVIQGLDMLLAGSDRQVYMSRLLPTFGSPADGFQPLPDKRTEQLNMDIRNHAEWGAIVSVDRTEADHIVVCLETVVVLWKPNATFNFVYERQLPNTTLFGAEFGPDTAVIAVTTSTGIKLHDSCSKHNNIDMPTGRVVTGPLNFSPDGLYLIVPFIEQNGKCGVAEYHVHTCRRSAEWRLAPASNSPPGSPVLPIQHASYSPDCHHLITAGGATQIWQARGGDDAERPQTSALRYTHTLAPSPVSAFSPLGVDTSQLTFQRTSPDRPPITINRFAVLTINPALQTVQSTEPADIETDEACGDGNSVVYFKQPRFQKTDIHEWTYVHSPADNMDVLVHDGSSDFLADESSPSSVQFSPDGRFVVAAFNDTPGNWQRTFVRVFRLRRRAAVLTIPTEEPDSNFTCFPGPVRFAEFSPDGNQIVTACDDGIIRIFDAWSGQELTEPVPKRERVPGIPRMEEVLQMARFSPDGTQVAAVCAAKNELWLRRVEPGGIAGTLTLISSLTTQIVPTNERGPFEHDQMFDRTGIGGKAGNGPVTLNWSPSGYILVTTPTSITVHRKAAYAWRSQRLQLPTGSNSPPYVLSAQFSTNGNTILGALQNEITPVFWHLNQRTVQYGEPVVVSSPSVWSGGHVVAAHYDPDGTSVITAHSHGQLAQWRTDDEAVMATAAGDAMMLTKSNVFTNHAHNHSTAIGGLAIGPVPVSDHRLRLNPLFRRRIICLAEEIEQEGLEFLGCTFSAVGDFPGIGHMYSIVKCQNASCTDGHTNYNEEGVLHLLGANNGEANGICDLGASNVSARSAVKREFSKVMAKTGDDPVHVTRMQAIALKRHKGPPPTPHPVENIDLRYDVLSAAKKRGHTSGHRFRATLWDPNTLRRTSEYYIAQPVLCVAFVPASNLIMTLSASPEGITNHDCALAIFDRASSAVDPIGSFDPFATKHDSSPFMFAVNPAGNRIASVPAVGNYVLVHSLIKDGANLIWSQLTLDKPIDQSLSDRWVNVEYSDYPVSPSAQDDTLLTVQETQATVWYAGRGSLTQHTTYLSGYKIASDRSESPFFVGACFVPGHPLVATLTSTGTLTLANYHTGATYPPENLTGMFGTESVTCLAAGGSRHFLESEAGTPPGAPRIAVCGTNGMAFVFELAADGHGFSTKKFGLDWLKGQQYTFARFSPDGHVLLTISKDTGIRLWKEYLQQGISQYHCIRILRNSKTEVHNAAFIPIADRGLSDLRGQDSTSKRPRRN